MKINEKLKKYAGINPTKKTPLSIHFSTFGTQKQEKQTASRNLPDKNLGLTGLFNNFAS
jgi:hypothetical protein